jgi:hypothetical protein
MQQQENIIKQSNNNNAVSLHKYDIIFNFFLTTFIF